MKNIKKIISGALLSVTLLGSGLMTSSQAMTPNRTCANNQFPDLIGSTVETDFNQPEYNLQNSCECPSFYFDMNKKINMQDHPYSNNEQSRKTSHDYKLPNLTKSTIEMNFDQQRQNLQSTHKKPKKGQRLYSKIHNLNGNSFYNQSSDDKGELTLSMLK